MQLPMALTDPPPLTITPGILLARFSQGFEFEMQYEIKRGAAKGPAKVSPPQILTQVGNLRILKGTQGKTGDKGSFLLDTNFATPFSTFDMAYEIQTEVDGRPVSVTSPIMEIQVVPGYEVKLAQNEIEIQPGGKLTLAGKVRREPTFEGGLIKLQAEDLPDHVSCGPVEVPEDKKEFTLDCEAEATAKPGAFPIRISSVAPNTGRKAKADYKIPDIEARLQVGKTRGSPEMKHFSSDHCLVHRFISRAMYVAGTARRRHECRRGTQECGAATSPCESAFSKLRT